MRKLSLRIFYICTIFLLGLTLTSCFVDTPVEKTNLDPVTSVEINNDVEHTITFTEVDGAKNYYIEFENANEVVVLKRTITHSGDGLGSLLDEEKLVAGEYKVFITALASANGNKLNSVRSLAATYTLEAHTLQAVEDLMVNDDLEVTFANNDAWKNYAEYELTFSKVGLEEATVVKSSETKFALEDLLTENGEYSVSVKVLPAVDTTLLVASSAVAKEFKYYNGSLPVVKNVAVDEDFKLTFEYDEDAKKYVSFVITLTTPNGQKEYKTTDLSYDLSKDVEEFGKYSVSVKAVPVDDCYGAVESDLASVDFEKVDYAAVLVEALKGFDKFTVSTTFKDGAYYAFDLKITYDGKNLLVEYEDDNQEKYYYFENGEKYHLVKGNQPYGSSRMTYTYVEELEALPVLSINEFAESFVWNKETKNYVATSGNVLDVILYGILSDVNLTVANLTIGEDSSITIQTTFSGSDDANKGTSKFTKVDADYVIEIGSEVTDTIPVKLTVPTDVKVEYINPNSQKISFTGVVGGYDYLVEVRNGDSKYTYTVNNYSSDASKVEHDLYMSSTIKTWDAGTYDVYMKVKASSSNSAKYLETEYEKVGEFVIPQVDLVAPSNLNVSEEFVLTFTDNNTVATAYYRFEVTIVLPSGTEKSLYMTVSGGLSEDLTKYVTEEGNYTVKVKAVSFDNLPNVKESEEVSCQFEYTAPDPMEGLSALLETLNKYVISAQIYSTDSSMSTIYNFTLKSDGKSLYVEVYENSSEKTTYYYYVQFGGSYHKFVGTESGRSISYKYDSKLSEAPILSLDSLKELYSYTDSAFTSTDNAILKVLFADFFESSTTVTSSSFTIEATGFKNFEIKYSNSSKGIRAKINSIKAMTSDNEIPSELENLVPSQLEVPEDWDFKITDKVTMAYSFTPITNAYKYVFDFVDGEGKTVQTANITNSSSSGLYSNKFNTSLHQALSAGTYKIYVTLSPSSSNTGKYMDSEKTYVCDLVIDSVKLAKPENVQMDPTTGILTWKDPNSSWVVVTPYLYTFLVSWEFSDKTTGQIKSPIYPSGTSYTITEFLTAPSGTATITIKAISNGTAFMTESDEVTITVEVPVRETIEIDDKWVGTWTYEYRYDTFTIKINKDGTATYFYADATVTENEDGTITIKTANKEVIFELTSDGKLKHKSGDEYNNYTYTKEV